MRFKVILFLLVLTLVSECKSCSLSDQLWHYQVELLPTLNLSSPISSVLLQSRVLIPEEAIHRCYDGRLDQQLKVDIFKPNITIFQLVFNYYKSFPEKRVTLHSIQSLVESAKEIAQHVTDCVHSGKRYQLGFTSMADQTPEEFVEFMGFVPTEPRSGPAVDHEQELSERMDNSCYPPGSFRAPAELNWRNQSVVTGVRHQYQCGSCWAFATVAALEAAYLKKYQSKLDLSEQQLVDCAKSHGDGCGSGTSYLSWQYVQSRGVISEKDYPYRAKFHGCPTQLATSEFKPIANVKKYCIRGQNWYGYNGHTSWESLTDSEIERAVAYFGPISICLNGRRLQHYKGGVMDDPYCSSQTITHMVLLVGYTADSWILKNSWGIKWGVQGYFQLAKRKNMCGINYEIAYPLV